MTIKTSDVHYISENDKQITYLGLEDTESENVDICVGILEDKHKDDYEIIGFVIELSPEGLIQLGQDLIAIGTSKLS